MSKDRKYYVRRVPSGFLGNSWLWWGLNNSGYTAYILGAKRFEKDEAENLVKDNPEKWEMYPCDEIDERLHLIFDSQDKVNLGTDKPCGWSGDYAENPHKPKQESIPIMNAMGLMGVLCDCAVQVDDETREQIEHAILDNLPDGWRLHRVLDSMELTFDGDFE